MTITLTREEAQQIADSLAGYRREMNEEFPCDAERMLVARLSAPEPEPVACAACSGRGWYTCGASDMRLKCPECKGKKTAPPQREWQGLTDEEYNDIYESIYDPKGFTSTALIRAIEAKLREKNNG